MLPCKLIWIFCVCWQNVSKTFTYLSTWRKGLLRTHTFISCDNFEPHFSRFLEHHSTFYYVVSNTHIKSVSQYCAKMKIIHSCGKVAVVVRGFTNPRPQILQAVSKFYGNWVWNLLYIIVLTHMLLWLFLDFVNVHAPQQQYCHSELSVETLSVLWCVLNAMLCFKYAALQNQ